MNRKKTSIGIILLLALTLAACGSSAVDNSTDVNSVSEPGQNLSSNVKTSGDATSLSPSVTLSENYDDALPVSSQLAIGTLMLEGTDAAVTVEQAGELLPSWQMLQALQNSGTAAQAELDAVLSQIQRSMSGEQLTAIKEMQLTLDSMTELMQEQGLARGAGGAGRPQTVQPPAGVATGGAGRPGGQFGPFGAGDNPSAEEQEAAMAERMNALAGTAMSGMLVSMLEAKAEGEVWELAAPNQEFELQRALIAAVAEATDLDQQKITTLIRDGQTLLVIAEANGADVDEIVARVVATETERVNQAVAEGSLEQTDADRSLADLEARVSEMLKQPLQSGGRGAAGDS